MCVCVCVCVGESGLKLGNLNRSLTASLLNWASVHPSVQDRASTNAVARQETLLSAQYRDVVLHDHSNETHLKKHLKLRSQVTTRPPVCLNQAKTNSLQQDQAKDPEAQREIPKPTVTELHCPHVTDTQPMTAFNVNTSYLTRVSKRSQNCHCCVHSI